MKAQTPTIALVGQPNSGKSTLFNAVAGFKVVTANYPGTTIDFTESEIAIGSERARIVDLPGIYSMTPTDEAEKVTREFLLSGHAHVIVAVVDASVLARSLEFVLELADMGRPMVVALNMMDEAQRKGMEIDLKALEERLGVPVIPTIASRGIGVSRVVSEAFAMIKQPKAPLAYTYDRDVEEAICALLQRMPEEIPRALNAPSRWVALRLLEKDESVRGTVLEKSPEFAAFAEERLKLLATIHDWPEETVLASHRHAVALNLFEAVAKVVKRRQPSFAERLDLLAMHPILGFAFAGIALSLMFFLAFVAGDIIADYVQLPFQTLREVLLRDKNALTVLVSGLLDGIEGGIGVVLPYIVPLLLLLSFYEDLGYLPRAAYLFDGVMHRLGLHGKSVMPIILGYGCSVPAVMATRILESKRDRVLTALIVPLVPCSARTVVILALIGGLLGPGYALVLYLTNLLVAGIAGNVLSRILGNQGSPGLILDIPPYRVPRFSLLLRKVWVRSYDFLIKAWPVLIASSIVMSMMEAAGLESSLNKAFSFLTVSMLGLPEATGVPLIFGVLRKELSVILLTNAMGTQELQSVLSLSQILVFTVFVTFYVPCVSTIATLVREIGWRYTMVSFVTNTAIAILAALLARVLGLLCWP